MKKRTFRFCILLIAVMYCFSDLQAYVPSYSLPYLKNNALKVENQDLPIISLDTIGVVGIRNLIQNRSTKIRVINIWATWCGPCVSEIPDFLRLHKKFKDRNIEWVTISADEPKKQAKVLKFLQRKQMLSSNYIYNSDDLYPLIETVDPRWRGVIPYTIIVAAGGKILYAQPGMIDPKEINEILESALR